jgi:diadenylate cyclase
LDLSFLSGVFASPWDIFRSLVDITIVSYLFYRLLGLIRGTRAEQLLKGLVLLLAFSAIASFLKLTMVNWLVEKLWILFAIVLPIVFQPELRRLLEQLGRGHFFPNHDTEWEVDEYEVVIEQIADAISTLSRTKVGALIILTRETDISEYMDSGVEMDSMVSAGLLINIFVPNTPLHDGAVIIKEGRISKAACFLPLSDNPYLDKRVGTRHRAGLGIAEVSDAVAVIVSEETGNISIAREGSLIKCSDAQNLKDALTKEFVVQEKWGDIFRRRWSADGEDSDQNRRP